MVTAGNIIVEGIEVPADVFTLEGFRRWYSARAESDEAEGGPRLRASFLGGDLYFEMSPQSFRSHAPVVGQINARLLLLAQDERLGRYFVPPSWITNPEAGLSTEPDGFLVTQASLTTGRVQLRRDHELQGTPDMVLEVISPSSVGKDRRLLMDQYARAGVREYWVVDARGDRCVLEVFERRDASMSYELRSADADGWLQSAVWGRSFRLSRIADPVGSAELGLPDFCLEVR